MHFRTQTTKQCSTKVAAENGVPEMVSRSPSSVTTLVNSEPERQVESPGVSCWDFAYSEGKCSLLSDIKTCQLSKESMPKPHERFLTQTIAPANDALHGGQQTKQKSKKHSKKAAEEVPSRTYLLSSPTLDSIIFPHTKTTISTLLSQPNTKLIYLVPQSNIVCPVVCALMRLPRASGSSFQVLPVMPEIDMKCGGDGRCPIADAVGVQDVVEKVLKNTKSRSFDGYISFEEEREAWTFLERVGKGVMSAAKKG
ncbi:hypothetical protein H2200_006770 [Cladophialophora chaetospira]|uniref:Uncharacterized protein n=1 Tax=Cladophialophora chaetospira TaxID=386627 RepID=A0AA39CI65_9EURO|nr:hypothetical protein H2200_006770 [Cladophialophora chaetospira]